MSFLRKDDAKAHAVPPAIEQFAPKPRPPEPLQLGATTLQSIEQITDMSAVQIERVADEFEAAAHEIAEGLREAARSIRRTGVVTNKRLANFVRVATTCMDSAKMMQQSVLHHDDPQIEPARQQTYLDALAAEMSTRTDGENA